MNGSLENEKEEDVLESSQLNNGCPVVYRSKEFVPSKRRKFIQAVSNESPHLQNEIDIELPHFPKYALCISYVGTLYSGLQTQNSSLKWFSSSSGTRNVGRNTSFQAPSKTIMAVLIEALFELGYIPSNSSFDSSIHATSRTDKGVHALRNLFCARLCLSSTKDADNGVENESSLLNTMCHRVNTYLKEKEESIVVHGAVPVTDSFNAISDCASRQYIYLMPCRYFGDKLDIDQVNKLLGCFEGSHSFHNYTDQKKENCIRTIFSVRLHPDEPIVSVSDARFLQIRLHGTGFMKHQIRRMIGIIVWLLVRQSDENLETNARVIERTIQSKTQTKIPMAPPQYLLMEDWFYKDGDSVTSLDTLKEQTSGTSSQYLQTIREAISSNSKDGFLRTIVYNHTWLQ